MLGEGCLLIYCINEWVGNCGLLGSLRKYRFCMTTPITTLKNLRALCSPLYFTKEIKGLGTIGYTGVKVVGPG